MNVDPWQFRRLNLLARQFDLNRPLVNHITCLDKFIQINGWIGPIGALIVRTAVATLKIMSTIWVGHARPCCSFS